MSIASRITQMEQHIGNAYDKIEDLGIDLTDVDKNIDNISSMLENVWDEYPKVTASDVEEATLNGTKKGRMKLDLKGNTEQEQLTGKNLYDINKLRNYIYSGGYFTPNPLVIEKYTRDGEKIVVNNGPLNSALPGIQINGLNKTITFSFYTNLELVNFYYLEFDSNGDAIGSQKASSATPSNKFISKTITLQENTSYVNVGFGSTQKTDYYLENVQVEQGSTATSYEQYCGRNTCTKSSVTNVLLKM